MYTTLQLTPGQLRKTIGLSKEAFRHWRQTLPAIRGRKGRSAEFSPGDAVAFGILRVVTHEFGVQIGRLKDVSTHIFRLCNETPWMTLESATVLIDVANDSCELLQSAAKIHPMTPVLVCPLEPVMSRLREQFLSAEPRGTQCDLRLRPAAVSPQHPSQAQKHATGTRN